MRLDAGEEDTHSRIRPNKNYPSERFETLTSVGDLYLDLCPRRQRFQRVHMASEKTEVARVFPRLNFRLQIGQFDAGMEGITPCTVWSYFDLQSEERKVYQIQSSLLD